MNVSIPKALTIALGDINNDEKLDVTDGNDRFSVRLNLGNGSFIRQTVYQNSQNPSSVSTVDLNWNNQSDIVVGTATTIEVFFNDCTVAYKIMNNMINIKLIQGH